VTSLETALRQIDTDLTEGGVAFALVGGLAVSVRTEPRFTRDADVAVAVADDPGAEALIHTLRRQGLDNVQVNMDWQHLIMNGENLAEYAALLAAEGLLGHQHANSGWGTFDDDNMVGATAFMETLELALELRRAGYGENGERLGFDLYPYTEDQVAAVKRSVLQWRFIDEVAGRIDEAALREAQSRKDAVRAYELVYAALGA